MDVPPGTTRVEMEGVGGGKEEITWQRYNGVRRSRFEGEAGEEREGSVVGGGKVREVDVVRERGLEVDVVREREREREMVVDTRDRGRRFVAEKTKEDVMWTEITKDLVIREAIEESGYGFEETEFFFYVMEYLRYVSFSPFPLFGVFFFFSLHIPPLSSPPSSLPPQRAILPSLLPDGLVGWFFVCWIVCGGASPDWKRKSDLPDDLTDATETD